MEINADTPISSLMNYELVSSLCDTFSTKVNKFKESASQTINTELASGLSSNNCLVAGQALLEESGTNTLSCINGIDTSITSKVVDTAKTKRMEELRLLRSAVIDKLQKLKLMKSSLQNTDNSSAESATQLAAVKSDIAKYEKKLIEVNSEYRKIG